jgi:hypothetical protein
MDLTITVSVKRARIATYLGGLIYIVGWILGFSPQKIHIATERAISRVIKIEVI